MGASNCGAVDPSPTLATDSELDFPPIPPRQSPRRPLVCHRCALATAVFRIMGFESSRAARSRVNCFAVVSVPIATKQGVQNKTDAAWHDPLMCAAVALEFESLRGTDFDRARRMRRGYGRESSGFTTSQHNLPLFCNAAGFARRRASRSISSGPRRLGRSRRCLERKTCRLQRIWL